MRHIRKTHVAPEILAGLLGMGTAHGVPVQPVTPVPDLKVIEGKWDWQRQRFELIVWSATFSPVPRGGEIPEWIPVFVTQEQ